MVGLVLKGSTTELGKWFTGGSSAQINELRQFIRTRLGGTGQVKEAISQLESVSPEALANILSYLKIEMFENEYFRDTIKKIVRKINRGKVQYNSTMIQNNRDDSTGFMTKAESDSQVNVAKEIHDHKSSDKSPYLLSILLNSVLRLCGSIGK